LRQLKVSFSVEIVAYWPALQVGFVQSAAVADIRVEV
jgi:hypothetical protein